jgi:hypothetical protein
MFRLKTNYVPIILDAFDALTADKPTTSSSEPAKAGPLIRGRATAAAPPHPPHPQHLRGGGNNAKRGGESVRLVVMPQREVRQA